MGQGAEAVQGSIHPILSAIDDLRRQIKGAQVQELNEYKRKAALQMLDSVQGTLIAFCLAASPAGGQAYLGFDYRTNANTK